MDGTARNHLMFVVFGRPGAGKTTVSQAAVCSLRDDAVPERNHFLYLDLDVCVPQWMRDNFSKGIYPSLQQRADFMSDACDYVNSEINSATASRTQEVTTIVSFSFVNTDIRDIFRGEFPRAQWILVDTPPRLAEERISAREGHFYKVEEAARGDGTDDNNSEWEFRPVDFPHINLDGRDAVEVNAKRITKFIAFCSAGPEGVYSLSCHCGRFRAKFRRRRRLPLTLWDCNCSDCNMRRNIHFMVPASDFWLASKEQLERETILYQWGTKTAVRRFCRTCGILPFYVPRSNPDGYAITFPCVDWGEDGPPETEVRMYDGVNWEESHASTGIAKETAK